MYKKLIITLDPGHGEKDNPYPPEKGFFEGTQMWKLAQFLTAELENRGFEVINTRPKITGNPAVDSRGALAAKSGSVLFLSLHSNAAASVSQTSAHGSEVFLSVKGRQFKPLAEKLLAAVCNVMNHPSRGVKERTLDNNPAADWYGVIRSAANGGITCAMLMEHGFHTNPKDAKFLTGDANLRRLAEAEAKIIAEYFAAEQEAELLKKFDLNGDGKVTPADALMVLRVAAGLNPYTNQP
jgi:N-acetylmuramoyl-L-alanine amidase